MKKLLLLLPFVLLFHAKPVEAQQTQILCVVSTMTPCNTSSNPGTGTQGMPLWQMGGWANVMFGQFYGQYGGSSNLFLNGVPLYSDLLTLWTGTKDATHCPSGNGTMVACVGGGGSGTVTSVAATVPAFLSIAGSPVTTTGTLAIGLSGTALPVLNGGTGSTTATGTGSVVLANSPTLVTPALGTIASGVATNLTGTATALNIGGNAATATSATSAGSATTATTAGNLSGTPALPNGTTATTQTVGDNTTKLATDAFVLANAGSSSSITPGTTTVVGATAPCLIDNSASTTMGCAALAPTLALASGTLGTTVPVRTVTTSPTVAATDMGGVIFSNVTGGGTTTIPAISSTVFASGMSLTLVNYSASTAAISTTPTINAGGGCVSGTGIPAGVTWELVSNGTTLDCNQTVSASSGGGSGTVASSTTGQIPVYTASTTVTGSANATLTAGAMTLGVSGTAGSVKMGNATSGTVTIQPVTGALGAVTASLPANTGTIAELNLAQTFSAVQTFGTNISIGGVTATGATGTGNNVFSTSPTLTTPALGTPSALVLTNATGTPSSIGLTNATAASLPLTGIATIATGTFLGNTSGSTASPTAQTSVSYLIDQGTQYTVAGTGACATQTKAGTTGTSVGQFTCTGTTGTATFTITLPTANGWKCSADDQTTAVTWRQTANTATSCTETSSGSVTSSDVIVFSALGR